MMAIAQFEEEFAAVIGEEHLGQFRQSLVILLDEVRANNVRDKQVLDAKD